MRSQTSKAILATMREANHMKKIKETGVSALMVHFRINSPEPVHFFTLQLIQQVESLF